MTSKSRTGASVVSNDANKKIFDQSEVLNGSLYSGNRFNFRGAVFGDASVSEIAKGGWLPNTQSAMMQLLLASILPVGSILQSSDSSNPFTTQQFEESITFSGTSTVDNIILYGVSVSLEVGDSANTIAEKTFNALVNSALFDMEPTDHVAPSNNFVLRHKSARPHNTQYADTPTPVINPDGENTGITAQSTVSSSSNGETSLGYGEWELFHTDNTTFSVPVYYYRRIA